LFKHIVCLFNHFGLITADKFKKIYMDISNIIFIMFLNLYIQSEDYMAVITHKASSKSSKSGYLNMLFAFLIISAD